MVKTCRARNGHLLIQNRAPLCREIAVLVAIVILRAERELILTPIAIHLQAVQAVQFPRQRATKVVEVSRTVLVAAALRQLLQHPVAIGGSTVQ